MYAYILRSILFAIKMWVLINMLLAYTVGVFLMRNPALLHQDFSHVYILHTVYNAV